MPGIDGAVISGKLLREGDETQGFNAATDIYENLVAAGVVDPTKVVRTALQDAASVAGLLITTEAAVSELPEDKPAMGGDARRRHGRHGRHGLLSPRHSTQQKKGRGETSGPFCVSRLGGRQPLPSIPTTSVRLREKCAMNFALIGGAAALLLLVIAACSSPGAARS